jgi:hypothetical protein
MDILDHIADYIKAELGADIFTDDRRAAFLVNFRLQYGKDRHYVHSLAAQQQQERLLRIFAAFRSGMLPRDIAGALGISERRVQQIIATTPMPSALPEIACLKDFAREG